MVVSPVLLGGLPWLVTWLAQLDCICSVRKESINQSRTYLIFVIGKLKVEFSQTEKMCYKPFAAPDHFASTAQCLTIRILTVNGRVQRLILSN